MSNIQKDMNLDFKATTSPKEVKNHLVVPIINRKNKVDKEIEQIGNLSRLESQIKVGDLVIDMRYQRQPNEAKVSKIARNFNSDAVGVIICSIREDGVIAVIDGGHRIAAMNLLGMQNSTIDALVYFGLNLDQEAKIFTLINDDRTKPKTSDIFKAQVIANDPKTVGLDSLLKSLNLEPANKPGNNIIRGIGTLKAIYENAGHDNTLKSLTCLKNAFGPHSSSFNVDAITALAIIFKRYPKISASRITEVLKKFGSINILISQANTMNLGSNQSIRYTSLPYIIVNAYNHKMRAHRVEPFNMNVILKDIWK